MVYQVQCYFPLHYPRLTTVCIHSDADVERLRLVIQQRLGFQGIRLVKAGLPIQPQKNQRQRALRYLQERPESLDPELKLTTIFPDGPTEDEVNIIVAHNDLEYQRMNSETNTIHDGIIHLHCLVRGEPKRHSFLVDAPANERVDGLKALIKAERPSMFSGVDIATIELIQVSLDASAQHDLGGLDVSPALLTHLPIAELFPNPRLDYIHIIVLPPEGRLKRSRSLSETQHARLKRTKFVTETPSRGATLSEYKLMQNRSTEKLLDDRPAPDADVAPIALYYHGFGHFYDITAHRKVVDMDKLKPKVDKFAEAMCDFYQDEDGRRGEALSLLNSILGGLCDATMTSNARGDSVGNVMSVASHGGPVTAVEFRNELAEIRALPHIEAVGHVAHLHGRMHGEWFERWRMPCLGITIVGYEITFYGVVLLGHQYRVVNLTPGLSCLEQGRDGQDREALYTAFAAALELQTHILSDTKCYTSCPPPRILEDAFRFPAVSELRRHDARGSIRFQIYKNYYDCQNDRQLYLAHVVDNPYVSIVIKFSQTYCIELHDYCSRQGHAPRILGYELLPGGWYGIAMEYHPNAVQIQSASDQLMARVSQLVAGFGEEGLVHGDLRDVNILCQGTRFWLVGFDWGGKDGEVEYPTSHLNSELLDGRSHQDLKIRREDDIRILRNTLNKFQKVTR